MEALWNIRFSSSLVNSCASTEVYVLLQRLKTEKFESEDYIFYETDCFGIFDIERCIFRKELQKDSYQEL